MASTGQEVYRIKFRIAHGDEAHAHHPLEIEAWVGAKTVAKADEAKSPVGNLKGGVAKDENELKPQDVITIKQNEAAGKGPETVNKDAKKIGVKPDDADDTPMPDKTRLDLQSLLSKNIGGDTTPAAPDEPAGTSPERKQSKEFDVNRLSGDSFKSETSAGTVLGAGPSIVATGKLADSENPVVLNRAVAENANLKKKNAEPGNGHEVPLSTKPIPVWLTPHNGESDKEFQAVLHVYKLPEDSPPYLDIDTTTLDTYTLQGEGQQVLRVSYYRPARNVLGVHDIFDYDSKHAGGTERAAAGAFKLHELSMQADDLAVMARIYFLTQISAARRAFLRDLRHVAQLHQRLDLDPKQARKEQEKTDPKKTEEELDAYQDEQERARREACDTVWELTAGKKEEKHDAQPTGFERFEDWVVRKMEDIAEALPARWSARHLRRPFFAGICLATILAALGFIWAPYWELSTSTVPWRDPRTVFGYVTLAGAIIVGIIFLFFALNFRTLAERASEMLLEWRTHRFADLVASLGSANANVAASRIGIKWERFRMEDASVKEESVELCVPWIPERLLAQFDEQLHVKERLTSLERVLKAHDTQTAEKMHHIEEDRARARRTVTAAASGIFVGLVTSEVGEMVLRYQHVAGGSDQNALLYWLVEQREAISGQASHTAAEGAGHHSSPEHEYAHRFHHEELWAHSLLLTITLVFSLIAAWIAIRKPANEQAGGHGHH